MSHNREATQLMQSHLEAVRAQVKDAESTYNTEGELLEIRSRYTTSDLFGDASGAVHLITKARYGGSINGNAVLECPFQFLGHN